MTNNEFRLDEFPDVKTGNGIDRDLAATTNDRLKRTVLSLLKVNETFQKELGATTKSLDALEKTTSSEGRATRKSISELTDTIKALDTKNSKLQNALFWLTVVTVILAFVQVIGLVYQIKNGS